MPPPQNSESKEYNPEFSLIVDKLQVISCIHQGRSEASEVFFGGGSGGPRPENFYICEALGLNFWRFLKQIRKQIACKLTVFYKNGYHFTKIITLLRKFYLKMSKF